LTPPHDIPTFFPSLENKEGMMACIPNEKIKLEKATVVDLRLIPGIDDETAQAILRQVKERGAFKDFEDLKEIEGVGEETVAALKDCFYIQQEHP
jgi:DNA uptake protein ComE-like DNA-binding protein